jgi:PAS domain S-box-containing protein
MITKARSISTDAHFAAIIASSDDAIISKGLDSVIQSWNQAAERIFGYTPDEAIGQSIQLIIPPDRYEEEDAIIGRIKAGERVDHFETIRRRKTGELVTVSITVSPVLDADGTIIGASKIARDITHNRRTEELLRLASEAAEVGLWDVNVVSNELYWDAACKAMFGISPDVPVTMTDFYNHLHPDDREATNAAYVACQDPITRPVYDVEYRTIGKEDGVVRWIAAKGRAIFDHNNRCIRTVGTTLDITTRKAAERRRDVMSKLTDLVQNNPSDVVLDEACALMGRHFEASRVGIGDLHPMEDLFDYTTCWTDGTVPPLLGQFPAHLFGTKIVERLSQGRTVVIGDLFDDPLSAQDKTLETATEVDTRAILVVPFVQGSRLRSIVYLNSRLPRRWEDSEVVFMQTFADRLRQLSDRRKAEAALAASEAKFRTLAQAMPNHVWTADAKGVTDWYNDEAHVYTGYERGVLSSDKWAQLVHPDDWDGVRSAWLKAVETQSVYQVELRIRRADGVFRWHLVRAAPIHAPGGGIARWIGTNTDVHDQKAAVHAYAELNATLEQRIAEAVAERKLFADVVESTDAFVQVADLDFNWLAINKASADEFERIYGVRPKAGDNILQLLADKPDHQESVRKVWGRALSGEQFTEVDEFGDPNLDRRYYEMKFNNLRDGEGTLIGAYQFVYDVTDRLRDQARLAEAEDQLRQAQKMEAVGQLTGGVAHDFNNMLAVVSGSLELLDRRTGAEDARAKTLISSALEASRRAGNLTQRLLAFSRRQPLKPEVVDPNKLVLGMSELFRHSLGAAIKLETVLAGGVWRIHADQNQLENVLLNLAVNSRDAMPDGGCLTIETMNASLDQRYVASETGVLPGQYVLIAVTDTGSGMPPDVIAKAFDPFFTTKDVGKGTGLGLSQVYGFVKQSGGHIKIYSEVGEGTTIKIYLPRHSANTDDKVVADSDHPLPTAADRELILVVDDEDLVRQFSVAALSDLGYRVLEANSAQAALAMMIERPDIDLLFTDIVMPEMNGRKLVDMAKDRRPDLPVIYTTGYTRNAIVHNGVLDEGVELIGKPFTLEELAKRVRTVLDKAMLAKARS